MNNAERIQEMEKRFTDAFQPKHLQIIDDSAKHIGHAGSRDGAGHFTVVIDAQMLNELSRVRAHQAVYAVVKDLIPQEIHALQIQMP